MRVRHGAVIDQRTAIALPRSSHVDLRCCSARLPFSITTQAQPTIAEWLAAGRLLSLHAVGTSSPLEANRFVSPWGHGQRPKNWLTLIAKRADVSLRLLACPMYGLRIAFETGGT